MSIGFSQALWVYVAAFALHEAEEWNAKDWFERRWVNVPEGGTDRAARTWLVFITIVFAALCAAATVPGRPSLAAWLFLPAVAFAASNGLQHVFWFVHFRGDAPGIFTSVVLLIPLGVYLLLRAVGQRYVPLWYGVALGLFMVGGLLQVVRDGNRVRGPLLAVFVFSTRLDKLLWERGS